MTTLFYRQSYQKMKSLLNERSHDADDDHFHGVQPENQLKTLDKEDKSQYDPPETFVGGRAENPSKLPKTLPAKADPKYYEPELKKDIAKSEYSYTEEARLIKKIKWKSVPYLAGADRNEKGVVTGFTLYAETDRDLATPLGKTAAAIGKTGPAPAEPVEIF